YEPWTAVAVSSGTVKANSCMDHADSFRHGHHVAPSHAVLIEQLLVFGGPQFPFEGEQ
ncbi:hypothetical protein BHE74_00021252, partial [Ensete ventricosum]